MRKGSERTDEYVFLYLFVQLKRDMPHHFLGLNVTYFVTAQLLETLVRVHRCERTSTYSV